MAAIGGRQTERDDAVAVRAIRIGARAQQDVGRRQIIAPHRQVQRSGPVRLARVHVRATLEQRPDRAHIGALDGIDERHPQRRRVRGRETQHNQKRQSGESQV